MTDVAGLQAAETNAEESSFATPPNLATFAGKRLGRVKCFCPKRGFGFVLDLLNKRELFVHYSHLLTRGNSSFRTLSPGEYIMFTPGQTERGLIAKDVTGVLGGPLLCEGTAF
jgi:cold shock CspA family protein